MECKLKDVLIDKGYIRGPFGSALKRSEMKEEGIPVYEQQNAIYNNRNFRYFIDKEKFENMKRFAVKENDLIISCSGTVGATSIIKKNDEIGIISQALLILRPDVEKVIPEFLYYFFKSSKGYNSIISRSTGSVQINIAKREIIQDIVIDIPKLDVQKKIIDILSLLDTKIELNNEMNKTLEEMAQALFKRWFVDFEFPNEDGEPYKSSGGEIVESEIGMIPKGWNVKILNDISTITMGVSPSSSSYNEENIGLPLLNGAADFQGKLIRPSKYTSEPKKICNIGDMVFGVRATIGNIVFADEEYALGRGVAAVKPTYNYYRELIYFILNNSMDKLISSASGSVFLNLKKADITDLKLCLNEKIVIKFHEVASNLINKIIENDKESEILKQQRDSLLPKLMSGEIRVEDIEANL